MGLSDDERFNGMMACAVQLYGLRGFRGHKHRPLNALLKRIWPALMANKSNKGLWLFGGEMSEPYLGPMNAVKAAFRNHVDNFTEESETNKTADDIVNDLPDNLEKKLIQYLQEYRPNMLEFLRKERAYGEARGKSEYADVLLVYGTCETFMYYVNRYNDALAGSFRRARDLVAEIQGVCLSLFSADPVYMAAYMADCVFDRVLVDEPNDVVTVWFYEECLHHNVAIKNISNPELAKIFRSVRTGPFPSSEQRLTIVLRFLGRSLYYEHQHQKLFKMIENHNASYPDDAIDLEKISGICRAIKEAHDKNTKEERDLYSNYDSLFYEEIRPQRREASVAKKSSNKPSRKPSKKRK